MTQRWQKDASEERTHGNATQRHGRKLNGVAISQPNRPHPPLPVMCCRGWREHGRFAMKRFAVSVALALATAVTALSPALAAHNRPHYVFARLGAGVCD